MQSVPLNPVPNQTVSFNVDGAFWQVHIFQSISFMCADITVNGNPVISAVRCFGGIPLMPYSYMAAPNFGNLIFDSDADWTGFNANGGTCNLFYLEQDEFEQFEIMLLLGNSGSS